MPAPTKTTISFSLISIPIALYRATRNHDIRFHQLHREDQQRIRYKKVCSHCGEEVKASDIVRGYQYDEDHFVVITDEDIEKIRTEKDKTIQILHFVDLEELSPVYFDKPFHALPEAGGGKAFELLRATLLSEQKVAIGRTVLGSSETLVCIIAHEEGLLIETLFFDDEITELPRTYRKPNITAEESQLARRLVKAMSGDFDLAAYHDQYQDRLRELIESKISGRRIVKKREPAPANVIDLMDALRQSVEQTGGTAPKSTKRGARSARAGSSKKSGKTSRGKGA